MSIPTDFNTWYSPWMKTLAQNYTKSELESRLAKVRSEAIPAAQSHLRAIQATASMSGNSSRRAHARNIISSIGDETIAVRGALEIHELFPERAKK